MLKYKFNLNSNSGTTLNIPMTQIFSPVVNIYENREDKFDINDLNVINQIIDYEKVKLQPVYSEIGEDVSQLNFNLNFYIDDNIGWGTGTTKVSDIGFTEYDIKNKTNRLEKTFIRLSFYDTNDLKTQNLLFFSTIFIDSGRLYGEYINGVKDGTLLNNLKTEFKVENPKINSLIKSFEGYYLYLFKQDFLKTTNTTIYLKVEYNNAINGRSVLFTNDKPLTNDGFEMGEIKTKIFIPITCKYDENTNRYIYWFKEITSGNVNLYQAKVK